MRQISHDYLQQAQQTIISLFLMELLAVQLGKSALPAELQVMVCQVSGLEQKDHDLDTNALQTIKNSDCVFVSYKEG